MSNVAGALTSLLMSLPLVAVPCLAVFGLPSIGPATAGADADESLELAPQGELGSPAATPGDSTGLEAAFTPIVDASGPGDAQPFSESFAGHAADRSRIDPTSDHRGAVANSPAGLQSTGAAAATEQPSGFVAREEGQAVPLPGNDAPAAALASSPAPAASADSWESSIARLSSLGIRNFHLTNGETPGEFYFTCSVRSSRNITQRFEAEGPNPAAVAQDVLAQVEKWQSIR